MMTTIDGCDFCTLAEVTTELTPSLTVTTMRHADDCCAVYSIEATA
jgi:hypothetical protein